MMHTHGPCSCGLFHTHGQTNCNSFSMYFSSMPNHHHHNYNTKSYDEEIYYNNNNNSSSVDCTLSLGTPSTRLSEVDDEKRRRSGSSCISNFCWDILQSNKNAPFNHNQTASSFNKNSNGSSSNSSANHDPLLARRCANCDTTSTPLWRNGPRGPKSLCNACGIRFKKEERRASAANVNSGNNAAAGMAEHGHYNNNSSWVQAQKMQQYNNSSSSGNEFRFMEGDHNQSDRDNFLSWRLNVTDNRPTSLVHDFTR